MRTRSPRTPGRVAVALAAVLLAAGCTGGGDDAPASASSTSSAPAGAAAATPGSEATAYPVPADAEPEPLPSVGARDDGEWALTLNGVRRVSEGSAVVTATLRSETQTLFRGFAEPGYTVRDDGSGKAGTSYEFSAVTLSAPGDPTLYQPLRDERDICACSWGAFDYEPGTDRGVYVYVTAPADAETVTVTVAGFEPFTDVAITS